ncbi:hypothetical protein DSO57_1036360 [Entomophthora muscae]|uniref:Uncharacterized protein n=1 Tax=Entomophthora muscae TaxID=34485 RepID=A0ACC2UJA8_9FUNG|nr:hypothetical protein DSO57_1036360 [Entomophthora muscae]
MEFEPAQFNAFEKLFGVEVQECHFYFHQAFACNVQANDDLSRFSWRNTLDTCILVLTQFSVLAFLKPEHTAQGFGGSLKESLLDGKIVTQRQGKARAKAKAIWNMYWAAVNGELKTTLSIEDYHKHLKANFGLHSKFNKLFFLLQHKQEEIISKLRDPANCVPHQVPHQVNLLHQGHPGCSQAQVKGL